ncbi:50S ribosomal protein L18 [Candidatus Phytoplasma prunorum]|uniref:50S ribosomal protein L18 n=1 Tax=Candidatus Phytoplasma prunorum TaxID=47565 RepID=UPI002FEE8E24
MIIKKISNLVRKKRHLKLRKKIIGTNQKPRLNIFRSNKYFYIQLIDDEKQITLCSVHSKEVDSKGLNITTATKVGELIAKKALAQGIINVVFDRGGFLYHGKIEALANASRRLGLKF